MVEYYIINLECDGRPIFIYDTESPVSPILDKLGSVYRTELGTSLNSHYEINFRAISKPNLENVKSVEDEINDLLQEIKELEEKGHIDLDIDGIPTEVKMRVYELTELK